MQLNNEHLGRSPHDRVIIYKGRSIGPTQLSYKEMIKFIQEHKLEQEGVVDLERIPIHSFKRFGTKGYPII